ncbi:hypothetical protein Hanom_Chr11g00996701 [Helianthus anomalus]
MMFKGMELITSVFGRKLFLKKKDSDAEEAGLVDLNLGLNNVVCVLMVEYLGVFGVAFSK